MSIFTDVIEMFDQLDQVQQYLNGNVKGLVRDVDGPSFEGVETFNVKMHTKHKEMLKSALRIIITRMTNDPHLDIVEAGDLFARAEKIRVAYHTSIEDAIDAYLNGQKPREAIDYAELRLLIDRYLIRTIGQCPVSYNGTLKGTLDALEAEIKGNHAEMFQVYIRSLDIHPNWGIGRRLQQIRDNYPISLMGVRLLTEIHAQHWPKIGQLPEGGGRSLGALLREQLQMREAPSATYG